MMCAGEEAVFEQCKPLLEMIGTKFYYLGSLGNGKIVKSLNNLLAAINQVATAEVIKTIKKYDVDPQGFYQTICDSSGNSFQFMRSFKGMWEEDYAPNFTLKLMRKDLGLAVDLMQDVYAPVANLVYDLYNVTNQYDEMDCKAIFRACEAEQNS